MSAFRKIVIRCEVDVDEIVKPFKVLSSGETPKIWAGVGIEYQFLLRRRGEILDVSNLVSLTLTVLASDRTGVPFMQGTIVAADIDNTVDEASWADGSKQHISLSFSGAETALAATADGTDYFLILSGFTDDDATDPDDFGWTKLTVFADGVPAEEGPIQAGNLIPENATYDNNGEYELDVEQDKFYRWTQGANDDDVTNGVETVSVSNTNFITNGTTITLNGDANQPVTAVIRKNPTLPADEIAALVATIIGGLATIKRGSQAVANNVESVTIDISGHGLIATPTTILPFVIKPNDGANIFCALRDGSATSTEFIVDLSALTETNTYKIGYVLIL
jgi:hypothetical protein